MSDDLAEARTAGPASDEADVTAVAAIGSAREGSAWDRWRERRRNRVSRWDRPPPPKDWRYVVGTVGKVLIATGLLMFGFVAYQLWGTGIETARAQNELENTFEEQFDEAVAGREVDDAPIADQTSVPDGSTTADDVDSDDPDSDADVDPDEPTTAPGVGGSMSDVVPGGVDLSDAAVDQDVQIAPGEAFAKLDIDKIGIDDLYVVPGVKLDDLKKGPGHYPDTPLPGQLGNAALAGHRTTYGAPFFDLDQLEPGDDIVVTMITGDRFVYRVTGSEVVTANDYWVIATRDPDVAELTLTTCDPKYTARNRLVVHSVLVPERSSPVGATEFYDLAELEAEGDDAVESGPDEIAGDDPTVTAPSDPDDEPTLAGDGDEADEADAAADVGDADDEADAAADVGDDPAAGGDADGTGTGGADSGDPSANLHPDTAELDAFSEGWFHDRGAFPQIALWGTVLTIITLLAYQVSKRTRHDSIGFLVGIAPFLIALYFFYQNVNRLLPPGL